MVVLHLFVCIVNLFCSCFVTLCAFAFIKFAFHLCLFAFLCSCLIPFCGVFSFLFRLNWFFIACTCLYLCGSFICCSFVWCVKSFWCLLGLLDVSLWADIIAVFVLDPILAVSCLCIGFVSL